MLIILNFFSTTDLVIFSIIIILIFFFGFMGKSKRKKRIEREIKIVYNAEQEGVKRDFVFRIIDGHHTSIPDDKRIEIKRLFVLWQAKEKKLFKNASGDDKKKLDQAIEKNDWWMFSPNFLTSSPLGIKDNRAQLFMEDVFTEPFSSLHDMDDWAMNTKITDIFILNGIKPRESKKFFIHKKNHFVNHQMTQGIIQFDVYEIKFWAV